MIAPERATADRKRLLDAKDLRRERFSLTTATVRALVEKNAAGDDQMVLEAPASSTCIDLMGDRMSLSCLQTMQQQATGMTTWLNHSYDIPEDACGAIEKAWIVEAIDPKQGAVHDLYIRMIVAPGAERAVKCFDLIKAGQKYGFSIGAFILDYEFQDLPDGGWVFVITALDLFEISLVGIPANQRAVVEGVGKAFSIEDRSGVLLARSLRKSKGYPANPEQAAAQKRALASRTLLGAEGEGEEGMLTHVPEPPTTAPAPAPEKKEVPPETKREPETEKHKPRPAGLPAYSANFTIPLGRFMLTASWNGESHVVGLCDAGVLVHSFTIDGERVIVKAGGKTLAPGTREKLEAAQQKIKGGLDHGACPEVQKCLNDAHDSLTTVLEQDENDDDTGTEAASVRAQLAERNSRFALLDAEIVALEKARAKMVDENAWLKELVAGARVTSAGRVTQRVTSGFASAATTDPDARRRSTHDVLRDLTHALAGHDAGDARTRSLV